MRRFHWRRKRAALALLPVAAMMTTMGLAAAATGTGTAPFAGSPGTATEGPGRVKPRVRLSPGRHVRLGAATAIRGRVTPTGSRPVAVLVRGRRVTAVRTASDGTFSATWRALRVGVYALRALVPGGGSSRPARSRVVRVNVYRPAAASYYGPGLYGGALACGGTLRPGTMGVASRRLPCGARLTLRYGRRSVRVQVIDRGPFSGSRELDLTAATRAKLRFPSTGTVLTTR